MPEVIKSYRKINKKRSQSKYKMQHKKRDKWNIQNGLHAELNKTELHNKYSWMFSHLYRTSDNTAPFASQKRKEIRAAATNRRKEWTIKNRVCIQRWIDVTFSPAFYAVQYLLILCTFSYGHHNQTKNYLSPFTVHRSTSTN